jgi:hypothetical protein
MDTDERESKFDFIKGRTVSEIVTGTRRITPMWSNAGIMQKILTK